MALRDKMITNAQPYLQPGEQVQAVFGGQKYTQWWLLLSGLILFFLNKMYLVVVTDRRIVVLNTTKFNLAKPTGVDREVPRATRIGPPSGLWWKCESLGERMYVHKRFHKDVEKADSLLPTS